MSTDEIVIVPNMREGHADSDYAKAMHGKGHKDFSTGYCCDTFYGMDMFTDDMICYWCAYGENWASEYDQYLDHVRAELEERWIS